LAGAQNAVWREWLAASRRTLPGKSALDAGRRPSSLISESELQPRAARDVPTTTRTQGLLEAIRENAAGQAAEIFVRKR
jgi:hypothetical protein